MKRLWPKMFRVQDAKLARESFTFGFLRVLRATILPAVQ
jgi:hypothetical protein